MKNLLVGFDGTPPTTPPQGATPGSHGVTTNGAFITAQFLAANSAALVVNNPQDCALVVINPDGQHAWIEDIAQALLSAGETLTPATARLPEGAVLKTGDVPAPNVASVQATTNNTGWTLTVWGSDFDPDCTCKVFTSKGKASRGIQLQPVNVTSTHFEVEVPSTQANHGDTITKVNVSNPDPAGKPGPSPNVALSKGVKLP